MTIPKHYLCLWLTIVFAAMCAASPQDKAPKVAPGTLTLLSPEVPIVEWAASEWSVSYERKEGAGESQAPRHITRTELSLHIKGPDGGVVVYKPLGRTHTPAGIDLSGTPGKQNIELVLHGGMVVDHAAFRRGDARYQKFAPAFPAPGEYVVTASIRERGETITSNPVQVRIESCPKDSAAALDDLKKLAQGGVPVRVDNYSATSSENDDEQLLNTFATKHWGSIYGEQMRLKLAGEALRRYKPEIERAALERGLVSSERALLDTAEGLIGGGGSERSALKRYETGLKRTLQKERLEFRKARLKSEQVNQPR